MNEFTAILKTAHRIIFTNFLYNIKIFALFCLAIFVMWVIVFRLIGAIGVRELTFGIMILFLSMFIAIIFFTSWIATAFHRAVLLRERPAGWLAPFNASRIWSYYGRTLFITFIIFIPLSILFALNMQVFRIQDTRIYFVIFFVVQWITVRLSLTLAGTAIDNNHSFADVWRSTNGHNLTFFALTVFIYFINYLNKGMLYISKIEPNFIYLYFALLIYSLAIGIAIITVTYDRFLGDNKLISDY